MGENIDDKGDALLVQEVKQFIKSSYYVNNKRNAIATFLAASKISFKFDTILY